LDLSHQQAAGVAVLIMVPADTEEKMAAQEVVVLGMEQ